MRFKLLDACGIRLSIIGNMGGLTAGDRESIIGDPFPGFVSPDPVIAFTR